MTGTLIVRLAAKVFPLRTPPEFAGLELSKLQTKYRKRQIGEVFAFAALAPLLIYFIHTLLIQYSARINPAEGAAYSLRADAGFWFVPAGFFGIITACILVHAGNRIQLDDGGREYRYFSNARTGFAASRMFLSFAVIFGGFGLLLSYFAAHTRFDLQNEELVIRRIWSLHDERHPYSQVTALREITDKDSSVFVIEFAGAEPWSTAQEVIFPGSEPQRFLETKTGKTIQRATN